MTVACQMARYGHRKYCEDKFSTLVFAQSANSRSGKVIARHECGTITMLRITAISLNDGTRLVVEGKLAGACVGELEKCWRETIGSTPPESILVDLSCVTFVDQTGKRLLKDLRNQGCDFVAEGLLARCLLQEIAGT